MPASLAMRKTSSSEESIEPGAMAGKSREIAIEGLPIGPDAILLVDVFPLGKELFVQRRDRFPLARDLGRDSLSDLRSRARIDQDVVFRLPQQIDESWGD